MKKKWIKRSLVILTGALCIWGGAQLWERLRHADEKVVVLDPGHGGTYPGFEAAELLEKDLVLSLAKQTKVLLEQEGYRVYMTRDSDKECSTKGYVADLACRPALARKHEADVFVSIHANAFAQDTSVRGMEAFYFTPFRDKKAAETIGAAMAEETGLPLRFTKFANYKVLRDSTVPSTLVEVGYLTNRQDVKLLADRQFQAKVARGLADGIRAFVPLKQPE